MVDGGGGVGNGVGDGCEGGCLGGALAARNRAASEIASILLRVLRIASGVTRGDCDAGVVAGGDCVAGVDAFGAGIGGGALTTGVREGLTKVVGWTGGAFQSVRFAPLLAALSVADSAAVAVRAGGGWSG